MNEPGDGTNHLIPFAPMERTDIDPVLRVAEALDDVVHHDRGDMCKEGNSLMDADTWLLDRQIPRFTIGRIEERVGTAVMAPLDGLARGRWDRIRHWYRTALYALSSRP
jgi:hypothetical protein